jgi:hypothetical protein
MPVQSPPLHLCTPAPPQRTTGHTNIHLYYTPDGARHTITPKHIRDSLPAAADDLSHLTGLNPGYLIARSLSPGGATALLCPGIETDVIKLVGRWKSDPMMTYLRISTLAHSYNLAKSMLTHGGYTFAPEATLDGHPVPNEAPINFVEALRHESAAIA